MIGITYLHSKFKENIRDNKIKQYIIQPLTSINDKYKVTKKQKTKTSKYKLKDEFLCEFCSFTFTTDASEQ